MGLALQNHFVPQTDLVAYRGWPLGSSTLLTRVSTSGFEPPKQLDERLNHLVAAIGDTRASNGPLVVKNLTHRAFVVLAQAVAHASQRPVYVAKIPGSSATGSVMPRRFVQDVVARDLASLPKDAIVMLDWVGGGSRIARAEQNVMEEVDRWFRSHANTRVALCTPALAFPAATTNDSFEVFDATAIGWDIKDTLRRRVLDSTLAAYGVQANEAHARAVQNLAPKDIPSVIGQAVRMARRDTGMQEFDPKLLELAHELRTTQRTTHNHRESFETDYATRFLFKTEKTTLRDQLVDTPAAIGDFLELIRLESMPKTMSRWPNKTLLLTGPPGTGKSTIAKCLASECGFPFFAPRSSELINSYIGKSAENINRFFDQVIAYSKMHGTPVMVFWDEIDALLTDRSKLTDSGGSREYGRVVNAILENVDGIRSDEFRNRVIFVGATNHARALDEAALSRFAVKIEVALPSPASLKRIFRLHLDRVNNAVSDEELDKIVAQAKDFSGRDAASAVERAGFAARHDGIILAKHLQEALPAAARENDAWRSMYS